MALGYDGKLYILAFDHRGSFQKKMFGIEGDPTPEETATITDAKKLIFEGMERRGRARRSTRPRPACWSTSSSAATCPSWRASTGLSAGDAGREVRPERVRLPVRRGLRRRTSRSSTRSPPRCSSATTRTGDDEMNERQLGRLKQLADWLHDNGRLFLFELLVPAEDDQLEAVGGDTDRYDAELRPELMRRAIEDFQNYGIEVDIWKIEGVDTRADAEMLVRADPQGRGPRERQERAPRPRRQRRQGRPLAPAGRRRRGLHRLRDRPLDLVGRAEGLPRRQPRPRARRPSRSPTTTCASSRSTTTRSRGQGLTRPSCRALTRC